MKTLFLSLIITLGWCYPKQSDPVIQKDHTLLSLKSKKTAIDQYIAKHDKELIVLVKVPGKNVLVRVKNEHWPEEIECTYNILRNQLGKVIFIAQVPYSESGDWEILYKHYFDEKGNTYAFSKEESIFNDNVNGGVIKETLLKYYDDQYKTISQINTLTDKKGQAVKENKNAYDFRQFEYSTYKNVSDCLTGYHIKLTN